ncbi:patatin-like phospholipase family protein [Actinocrispum sp. NPDC049592]|uniref:patatin-like phospholipase family protein n=1 Tax=Actinocrispum sp. NPDC049592 TaxID=3154835 RepID=UPI00341BA945
MGPVLEGERATVALVLSGGGAQAAYFGAGVAAGLADAGIRPDIISGTSAGALNAGLLASGLSPDALVDLWSTIDSSEVYRVRRDFWRLPRWSGLFRRPSDLLDYALESIGWRWLLDISPARELLVRYVGEVLRPDRTVVVSAVNQTTGEVTHFTNTLPSHDKGFRLVDLTVDHLLASAAAPLLFPPVVIDDESYVDAGLVANTPLTPALAYTPDVVVVVASSHSGPLPDSGSLDDALALLFDNVARFSLMQDYRHAQTVNTLAAAAPAATAKRPVSLVLVEPAEEFSVSGFLRFCPESARDIAAHGRDRVQAALASLC